MDERAEYQLRWLEEAVSRVISEARTLASQVDTGAELVEPLVMHCSALHDEIGLLKGKLTLKPEDIEEKVEKIEGAIEELAKAQFREQWASIEETTPYIETLKNLKLPPREEPVEETGEARKEVIAAVLRTARDKPKRRRKHEVKEDKS